ncbi:MAG: hypothetical protein ABSC49_01495 [Candidatus Microgenomates bacterium]|jgi:hypothetical protein
MTTEGECRFRKHCGFVKFRENPPDSKMISLPHDGHCGKLDIKECPRYIYASTNDKEIHKEINGILGHGVTNAYTDQSLINNDEIQIVLPPFVQSDGSVRSLIVAENHN